MSQHDILIFNKSTPMNYKDIDVIQKKGFPVSASSDFSELGDLLKTLHEPIIVINATGEKELQDFFYQVCNNASLRLFPILYLADEISGTGKYLDKAFPLALTLQSPAEASKVTEALKFIARNYCLASSEDFNEIKTQEKEIRATKQVEEAAVAATEATPVPEKNSGNTGHSISEDKLEISIESVETGIAEAKKLFSAIRDTAIPQSHLGGHELPLFLCGARSIKKCCMTLPEQEDLQNTCIKFLSELKTSARDALERVNAIALKIIAPFNLDPKIVEITKAASILYTHSYASQGGDLLTRPYSFRGGAALRKDICSAIKDSALNMSAEGADPVLVQMIAQIGKIIGQEPSFGKDDFALAASAVVAADMINRTCYEPFFWNVSAAYGLLRKIRHGQTIGFIHPAVICVTLKLMAEALCSKSNTKLIGSVKAVESDSSNNDLETVVDETVVEVPLLTAGMRLSRPLKTEDGEALLEEDLLLDDDLIMRIWQLSSKKVLHKPIVKKNPGKKIASKDVTLSVEESEASQDLSAESSIVEETDKDFAATEPVPHYSQSAYCEESSCELTAENQKIGA